MAYAHLPLPRSTILRLWSETPDEYAIVSCARMHGTQVSIPVSKDTAKDSVMNVAQAGAGQPVDFFGHSAAPSLH